MSTNRVEAFSDGVFAIVVTLLVLDIAVPKPAEDASLGHELLAQWPSYAAYVVSFMTIGIIWINHHASFSRLREVDHSILVWNLVLLLCVGALPFTTSLMATYLKEGQGERLAAAIYGASFLVMGWIFGRVNHHIYVRRSDMLVEQIPEAARLRTLRYARLGQIPYALATGLALVSPYITIVICGLTAIYYALPIASGSDRGQSPATTA